MNETTKPTPNEGPKRAMEKSIHTDFTEDMSYADYLQLDKLLSAQKPLSKSHDEMLFILLHQTSELWFKLMIHELNAALEGIRNDRVKVALKTLSRVARIQAQIIQSWDVLSTLTPADYLTFRDDLGHASGFQSWQYRTVEFLLGNKSRASLKPYAHAAETHAALKTTLESPSLYDEALRFIARRGMPVPAEYLERDWSLAYVPSQGVEAAWAIVYSDVDTHWELYELAEKLVDVEDWFQQWRFRHVKTVERVIGFKTGTGGSSGVPFLMKALEIRLFPELWSLRTTL
jgi:tryptophan 2,3-dioxygenase